LLPAFGKPAAVRLTIKSDNTGTLDVKIMRGPRENEPARLIESKTIQASQQQVTDFLQLLVKANFCVLSVRDERYGSRWAGVDSALSSPAFLTRSLIT
jgi:hypothetical protein